MGEEKPTDWIKKKIASILWEHTAAINKYLGKR